MLAAAVALSHPAAAQTASPSAGAQAPLRITPPAAVEGAKDKAAREHELDKVRADQRKAAENEARLRAEIDAIGQDRKKLSRTAIEAAARLRDLEARLAASETRLAALDENEREVRRSLEGRRAVIADLLAVLQRMGRRPPPALLVRPEDALAAVRSAIMLGAVLPDMRAEVETLAADLAALVKVRREIAEERQALDRDLASLAQDRQRMALLVEERQKRQTEAERALDAERQRAVALARQAENLKDLIAKLEQDHAIRQVGTVPHAPLARGPVPPRDIPRLSPAVAFAAAKGSLPLPVNGIRIREFGAPDGLGGAERGQAVATRVGAQVTAPADGWVVYAGPFRSYGQLLILNAGGGYHILLAGMDRISVDQGQFVLTGEPVATMGSGPRSAGAVAVGSSQPILYIEFRKDGTPVDPGPWWANPDSEKVRG
ncbi:MAG: peptidoglycan DD-metalloendopeptidase family protein [Variibacter sp.]|nr:peptidoglycan DD-metalloendopeptidase family protein [Variibacter sp.]